MQSGEIKKDGQQPFLPDLLSGKVQFSFKRHTPGQGCFSANYARQMVNSMTRLQATQHALLTETLAESKKVRNYESVKSLLKNMKAGSVAQAKRCAIGFYVHCICELVCSQLVDVLGGCCYTNFQYEASMLHLSKF